jgi:Transglycosylase SLT domain
MPSSRQTGVPTFPALWRKIVAWAWLATAIFCACSHAEAAKGTAPGAPQSKKGSVVISVCRLVDAAARRENLPAAFLTRLIWQESSFRPNVVSPAGAQGIAQFMPGTADERGLADPFDPEQAIPKAAELLHDLRHRFGNLGLAAAAYNAGAARVSKWLAGEAGLPLETRDYVLAITRHPVESWKDATKPPKPDSKPLNCPQTAALIRRSGGGALAATSALLAPWGVQLSGSFSKAAALAQYDRERQRFSAIFGQIQPMILGTPMLAFGSRPYYRVRLPAATRVAANSLCRRIERAGGACAVLRN